MTPQKIATIGIKYVTAEANKGEASLTNLLNSVWAMALLNNASKKTKIIDSYVLV